MTKVQNQIKPFEVSLVKGKIPLSEAGDKAEFQCQLSRDWFEEIFRLSGDINKSLHSIGSGLGLMQGAMLYNMIGTMVSISVPGYAFRKSSEVEICNFVRYDQSVFALIECRDCRPLRANLLVSLYKHNGEPILQMGIDLVGPAVVKRLTNRL